MALKKPGDFFQKKEVVKLKEEIDQLVNPELSSVSDAYEKYKDNVNKYEQIYKSGQNHRYPNLNLVRIQGKYLSKNIG